MLSAHRLCITVTKLLFNYQSYKTKLLWHSINVDFNILFPNNLLPLLTVYIIIWTHWLPLWLIQTQLFGKAEPSIILELVVLIILKSIDLAKWFILSAIFLCIDQYQHATIWYSPIIFLYMKSLCGRIVVWPSRGLVDGGTRLRYMHVCSFVRVN